MIETLPVTAPPEGLKDGLAHYCAVHVLDEQCERDRAACRSFCGDTLRDQEAPDHWPDCVVCISMAEARGDFEANDPERARQWLGP